MKTLNELRVEIDLIDDAIRNLFEKRMDIVKQVKIYKKENQIQILDKNREEEVIEKNISKLKDASLEEPYKKFLVFMMDLSKDLQK
jgi:monofunctional chorismate mutase